MNSNFNRIMHEPGQLSQSLFLFAKYQGLITENQPDITCSDPAEIATYAGFEAVAVDVQPQQLMATLSKKLALLVELKIDDDIAYVLVQSRRNRQVRVSLTNGDISYISISSLYEFLTNSRISALWTLSPHPRLPITVLLKAHKLRRYLVGFTLARFLERVLYVASWWLLGDAILSGKFEVQVVLSWLLLLGTASFLKFAAGWCHIQFSTFAGIILKKKMLDAILRQHLDRIRQFGAGQLLGRSLESEALLNDTLTGLFNVTLSLFDIILAAIILIVVSQFSTLLALFAWMAGSLLVWRGYYFALKTWSQQRIQLSDFMVEHIAGHQTRQVQQHQSRRHIEDDQYLDEYMTSAREMDNHSALLDSLLPYGWLLLASITLFLPLIQGADNIVLASSIGAILLSWRAFQQSVPGVRQIIWSFVVWHQIKPLVTDAEQPQLPLARCKPGQDIALLRATGVSYHHHNRHQPTFDKLDFEIQQGDRIMLTGASGAGKSTLLSIIAGLRAANTGQIVLHNRDCSTLATAERRRRLCLVPQFQDNHIFTNSLAFNLLMGRNWPPTTDDLEQAFQLCGELGLMPLIEKMPSGLFQPIGEMGWKLSHGERSRVFIARALLQQADLLIFDESLAALDPNTLIKTLNCIEKHASGFLLCAHP